MTGYLLDTNIVRAFAPGKQVVSPEIASWFETRAEHLFLSVISVIEIEAGICKLWRTGASRRADALRQWLGQVLGMYEERIVPLDTDIGRTAGAMTDLAKATGHQPGLADIAIAATAAVRRLTVLTRNAGHFEALGVPVLDPFGPPLRTRE